MQTLNIANLLDRKFIGADDLRKELTNILSRLSKEGEVVITQHGKPQAVLMNLDAYLELQEQMADADPKLIEEINEAVADVKAGNGVPAEKVWEELGI